MMQEKGLSVEEKVSSLFQTDTLLPEQYLDTFRRKTHLEPEKRLMLAVLEDAIACFQKYIHARDGKGKTLFRDATEWIEEENADWLFSFENICEMLGFNPRYVRNGLMRWKEARVQARPQAKVYRLAPRESKKHSPVASPSETGQRLLKAAGR